MVELMANVPDEVYEPAGHVASPYGRLYYGLLCKCANEQLICWPGLQWAADQLGISKRQVVRLRNEVVAIGWVRLDPPKEGHRTPTTVLLFGTFAKRRKGDSQTQKGAIQSPTANGKGDTQSPVGVTQSHPMGDSQSSQVCQTRHAHIRNEPAHEPAHVTSPLNHDSFSEQLQTPDSTNEILPISSAELFGENLTIPRQTKPRQNWAAQADEVYEYWKVTMRHPGAIFDAKRRRAVEGRLKDGFTVDQLKAAVDGCARSPFHQGGGPEGRFFDGIALICRDAEHVDGFIKQGDNSNDGLPRQERAAPLSANSQRLIESFAGIARRTANETGSDDSRITFNTGPALLR